jgi:hypothetical protein
VLWANCLKPSFVDSKADTFRALDSFFRPFPKDTKMAQQFPKLFVKKATRFASRLGEMQCESGRAWIYSVNDETDCDFHVSLCSPAQLTAPPSS